ncbi:MAG: hypothetical protein HY645_09710 [Acidobacteria bacterium]|nr:hypothetical protein [Acidobacteriota bacterium]
MGLGKLLCSFLLARIFSLPVLGSDLEVPLSNGQTIHLTILLDPAPTQWEPLGDALVSDNGYSLRIEENAQGRRSELSIQIQRMDGRSFSVQRFQTQWLVSDPTLYAIWTYNQFPANHRNYRALKTESFGEITSPNYGIPFVMALTRGGDNLLSVGPLSQNRVFLIYGSPGANGYTISLQTQSSTIEHFSEVLFTDVQDRGWFEQARFYASWVDENLGYEPFPISPAAYFPVYDIWYWAFDRTSPNLYWTTLSIAKNLGFRSYLFDAGWESEAGELVRWLEGTLGNYSAPQKKLPGFRDFLRNVQDYFDMNVVLWMAPYAMGRKSHQYPALRNAHVLFRNTNDIFRGAVEQAPYTLPLGRRFKENVNLCPQYLPTHNYLSSLFERVSDDYAPNGYWLDFQDLIPFVCESWHGHEFSVEEGFNTAQARIKEAILEKIPQPTVELRYPVANLNNKPYANIWQSLDSPEDFDAMRLCSLMMRAFSSGVVMSTDEMYWSPRLREAEVAKFVSTTILTGVPALGADFLSSPAWHQKIVQSWLHFYSEHQQDLTQGEFVPFGDFVFPDHKIVSSDKVFFYLRSGSQFRVSVPATALEIFLVNCTDFNDVSMAFEGLIEGEFVAQVLNGYLEPVSRAVVRIGSDKPLRELIPQGGMLKLKRFSDNPVSVEENT